MDVNKVKGGMSVVPVPPYGGGVVAAVPPPTDPLENRRKILTEVREHLDLLKEFEGIISDEDLAQRKRDLFRALPPAPPPAKDGGGGGNKRARLSEADNTTNSAAVPAADEASMV